MGVAASPRFLGGENGFNSCETVFLGVLELKIGPFSQAFSDDFVSVSPLVFPCDKSALPKPEVTPAHHVGRQLGSLQFPRFFAREGCPRHCATVICNEDPLLAAAHFDYPGTRHARQAA